MRSVAERRITAFVDEPHEGSCVAALSCGHRRELRHRPPTETRPWVLDAAGRASRLGTWIECPLCEEEAEGGELVCYASLVCPECGTVLDDTHDESAHVPPPDEASAHVAP